jgi:heat shock protein HslJ
MNTKPLLLCIGIAYGALAFMAACATRAAPPAAAPAVANASSAPLADSQWRLLTLANKAIVNPPGQQQVYFVLQPRNTGVTGFSGCNRMFGRYALDGETLKFDAMGGTKMACTDAARTDLENRFLAMFAEVASWKITDRVLQLVDANGAVIAELEAQPANATPSVPAG